MVSQARFVHIVDDVPELEGRADGPVLVVALEGFLDAGNAGALAVAHLLEDAEGGAPGRVVASLDVDEFYDYRARRPALTFFENRYTDYEAPRLLVRLLTDAQGTPYLLLSGPEPDTRWEGFAQAVRTVVEHFGVRLVLSLGAVPMAVPHTRPVQLTNHANAERLLVQDNVWQGEIRIPASALAVLEMRLGEWGHDAVGFVAHIPHYIAQFGYPQASASLLVSAGECTGLVWDVAGLIEAGARQQGEIERQLEESSEVRDVVAGLERQYDAFHDNTGENLLAEESELPTGEQLGQQFEQFLAGLDDDPRDQ
ncbi:PAC2 family protein [Alteromonas gracilis]